MKEFKIMKKTLMILMVAALVALPTMAQQNWRNQQPMYGSTYRPQATSMPSATYHTTTFHSTGSTMMRTGSSYSARPVINRYGSAVSNGGPRRSQARGGSGPHKGLINWGSGDDSGGSLSGGSGEGGYVGEGGWTSSGEGIGGGIVTPDQNDDDDRPNGSPIGDAVLPLLLCAIAFCGVVYLRRRRALSR